MAKTPVSKNDETDNGSWIRKEYKKEVIKITGWHDRRSIE